MPYVLCVCDDTVCVVSFLLPYVLCVCDDTVCVVSFLLPYVLCVCEVTLFVSFLFYFLIFFIALCSLCV